MNVDWIPATVLSGTGLVITALTYRRIVRQDKSVGWEIEKRDGAHMLICTAGVAEDVKIDLGENNTATSWGQLEYARLTKGSVVRIATYMVTSHMFEPDSATVTWRVGRRRYSWSGQIL